MENLTGLPQLPQSTIQTRIRLAEKKLERTVKAPKRRKRETEKKTESRNKNNNIISFIETEKDDIQESQKEISKRHMITT